MHKIGIVTDIHGNDAAFRKVLELFEKELVDEIVILGDAIAIGPNGNNVLAMITKLKNTRMVIGNHESYYLTNTLNPISCTEKAHQDWVKKQISEKHYAFLEKLPRYIIETYYGIKILYIHYPIENNWYVTIPKSKDASVLDELFKNYDVDIVFFGHDHRGAIKEGKRLYVNPGSCGCPYPTSDYARCAILAICEKGYSYNVYELQYDPTSVIEDMDRFEMPERDFIKKAFYQIKEGII